MDVKTLSDFQREDSQPEILFWVGCAGSFDPRAQKVTVALCKILDHAGISFAILGNEESCTGDPARRAGNEFVFQMLALQNIETLNMYKVEKIVTACPHCFNTLKNEYPQLGGHYEVVHHSQLIQQLIGEGKIKMDEDENRHSKLTLHDSCYLGRVNGEYEAPRNVLKSLGKEIIEMKRNRERGLCCGAGGAQMFKEDEEGERRINEERIDEALKTNTETIVTNCPFCLTMISDGVKAKEQQERIMVYDISELIVQSMTKLK